MSRSRWERLAGLAGIGYVAAFIVAFALGIEVGPSDREIRAYYASSGHRTREVVAFFLISAAALALILFANGLRSLIARSEGESAPLAALCWAGGITSAALVFAGNALSRATAFAAMDSAFKLDPNTRRLFEDAGFLLFASGAIAAILLVLAVSVAALRFGVLPRWLGWAGFAAAVVLPLAVAFIGFLVLWAWVLAVSGALGLNRSGSLTAHD